MPSRRQLRVNQLLQEEISKIIRTEVDDPDVGFTTITSVEVSGDLGHARVYASVLGSDNEVRDTLAALARAQGLVRYELAQRLHLKQIPELTFELDETAHEAQHIESLLTELKEEDSEAAQLGQELFTEDYSAIVAQIAKLLEQGQPTVIFVHHDPDGDAIGSGLALSLALQQLGQTVPVLSADPLPTRYQFLPATDRLTTIVPDSFQVAIVLDVGDWQQLGTLADSVGQASTVVWIDHHDTNQGGADIDYLDAAAAATALQVYQIIQALGLRMDPQIATCLYCGLATDTGFFTFENTSIQALTVAGELAQAGADPYHIAAQANNTMGLAAARLRGRALADAAVAADGRIVYAVLAPGDFAAAGAKQEDTEGIVGTLKLIAGGQVQVLFKAIAHNRWRISLRSAFIDVAAIAQQFGGGGHSPAAGCQVNGSLSEVRVKVIGAITQVLNEKQ